MVARLYDLRVAEVTPTSIRLVCATHPYALLHMFVRETFSKRGADGLLWLFARDRTCSFDITARKRESSGRTKGSWLQAKPGGA